MLKSCKIFGFLVAIVVVSSSPMPQERRKNTKESSDFNFGGEKALRSLEQVAYPDGQNRGRAILKDSYGNPVTYDALDDIDKGKPSRNKFDTSMYVIPGYASGILQPHEVPSRGTFLPETGRTVTSRSAGDGRIHFIDPLTSTLDNDKTSSIPLPGLLPPPAFGNDENSFPNSAIDIPKPNIENKNTPQTAINDPLNQPLFPPAVDTSGGVANTPQVIINDPLNQPLFPPTIDTSGGIGQPSIDLQLPGVIVNSPGDSRSFAPSTSASSSNGIDIPRPNLDANFNPIDNSSGPINVGLLPPDFKPVRSSTTDSNSRTRTDTTNQDGTVFYNTGDIVFAPKPSTGLLPPKEPNQIDSNFNFNQFNNQNTPQAISTTSAPTINKFTGSFGGSSGVLGGRPSLIAANNRNTNNNFGQTQFTTSSQDSTTSRSTTSNNNNQLPVAVRPSSSVNKFTGSFGGPAGVLTPLGQNLAPPPAPTHNVSPVVPQSQTNNNKFGTSPTTTINQLPSIESSGTFSNRNKDNTANKFSGSFGGPPGILKPFDN